MEDSGASYPDETPLHLDLLRADLYRLLDELVHAGSDHHTRLVMEFERAWEQFKQATARRLEELAPGPDLAP